MPELTDRELADRAQGGDLSALAQLMRRHQRRIHPLATHLLRDRVEAEDIAQETFIRAFRAFARFDGRSEPFTWLYRIAINLSLNALRTRRSRQATADAADPSLSGAPRERPPAATLPVDAEREELYRTLMAGIDALSVSLRTTLVLVCIDGRSHDEASAILGARPGTIAWRVHEARRKLRAYMSERGFDREEIPE